LIAIHSMTSDEYKELYGLPWKHGLCGRENSMKLSKNLKERYANGFQPDLEAARKRVDHSNRRPDQPFFTKIRAENVISGSKKRIKYFHEDYKNVLKRMLEENKVLDEVCKDSDMPSYSVVYKYSRRNKEFRKELDKIYERFPFSIQARANKLSEDKFRQAIIGPRQSGFSVTEISRSLGVSENMIRRRLK